MSDDDAGVHRPVTDTEGYNVACLMRDVEAAPDPHLALSLICSGATQLWPVSACWMVLPRPGLPALIAISGFAELSADTLRRLFDSGAPACLGGGGPSAEPMAWDAEAPDGCGDCSLAAQCGTGPRAVIPLGGPTGRPAMALLRGADPIGPSTLETASTILCWLASALANRAFSERTSEIRFRQLFNAISDMVFISGPDGRIRDGNAAVCDQLGYMEQELRSLYMADLAAPGFVEAAIQRPADIAENGDHAFDSCLLTRGGLEIPVHCRVRRFVLEGETYVLGIARDISERQRALDNVHQAQKMEAVGRMAGGVAHDFNNLLAAILVCTDMLLSEIPEDDWTYEEITVIQKAATSAADLTKQLLVFGSKQPLQVEPFELGRLVEESVPMLRRAIPEHTGFEHRRSPISLFIEADRNQIEQVLVNLVLNARDAMSEGGKLVVETVLMQESDMSSSPAQGLAPGPFAALVVSDDGVGMDAQTQAQIFEPFFTTKSRGQGTGLGLSSVFGIVNTHQGTVAVDSAPGKGSRFTVRLPLREPDLDQDLDHGPTVNALVESLGAGERVLLVEDDDMMRRVANLLLVRLGYQVHLASDGHEAITLLDDLDDKPDLIITDLIMPNMSGSELATRVLTRHPDMKVLFMTGHSDAQSGGLAREHREFRVLLKPFSLVEFSALVREVLQD